MKQPDNKQAKMFGNDGPVGNDAEIIVYYEYNGPAEPVLRIPFWYYKEELGMFEHFEAAVHRTAKHLRSPTRTGLKGTSMFKPLLMTST